MANKKISDLTAGTSVMADDIFEKETSAPASEFVTAQMIADFVLEQQNLKKVKFSNTFDQWQPEAGTFKDLIIGYLPPGALITSTKIQATVNFQNASETLTKVKLILLDVNSTVYQTGDGVTSPYGTTGTAYDTISALHPVATNPITLEIDLSDDPLSPTINDLTAGTVETTIWYVIG